MNWISQYYILFIDAWVTKTLDLKYSAGYKQHPAMLIIKVKTFITNLVYGPVSSWAYLITWEFSSLGAVLMSSSFNYPCTMLMVVFGAKLTASVVQSWSAPSHQALMKWSHDVTPPSPGVGTYPALPAQVSSLSTCDDLLPVKMCL